MSVGTLIESEAGGADWDSAAAELHMNSELKEAAEFGMLLRFEDVANSAGRQARQRRNRLLLRRDFMPPTGMLNVMGVEMPAWENN